MTDAAYSGSNATSIGNWAVTFIPRGSGTTDASPFGNNITTLTGTGGTNNNGTFTLNLGNNTIKNEGSWDWALMVQIIIPATTGPSPSPSMTLCFSSDPEMDVS